MKYSAAIRARIAQQGIAILEKNKGFFFVLLNCEIILLPIILPHASKALSALLITAASSAVIKMAAAIGGRNRRAT